MKHSFQFFLLRIFRARFWFFALVFCFGCFCLWMILLFETFPVLSLVPAVSWARFGRAFDFLVSVFNFDCFRVWITLLFKKIYSVLCCSFFCFDTPFVFCFGVLSRLFSLAVHIAISNVNCFTSFASSDFSWDRFCFVSMCCLRCFLLWLTLLFETFFFFPSVLAFLWMRFSFFYFIVLSCLFNFINNNIVW